MQPEMEKMVNNDFSMLAHNVLRITINVSYYFESIGY